MTQKQASKAREDFVCIVRKRGQSATLYHLRDEAHIYWLRQQNYPAFQLAGKQYQFEIIVAHDSDEITREEAIECALSYTKIVESNEVL